MSNKDNGNQNSQSAKVLRLGLNISVSGEPGTDFEVVLDDKDQKAVQSLSQNEKHSQALDILEIKNSKVDPTKYELERTNSQEVIPIESTRATNKHSNTLKNRDSSDSSKMSDLGKEENSNFQDKGIISQIKSTMEHFEKFSDHLKEIPRLKKRPIATSTPFSDKYNSKSESNLVCSEFRPRKYSYLYEFSSRKDSFRTSLKPLGPDLFLKPLPGEGYYKRGIYPRYYDFDPYRHYGSDNSLNKTSDCRSICLKSSYDMDKFEGYNLPPEPPPGILKKSDSENGDKQSTSSADSIKDIKIYQSGGILIMQNFKDGKDIMEKKEISEFSAKLIENCNKLKMEVNSFQEDKHGICNSSDENKNSGKMVQFDLSSIESQKSKEGDSSSNAFKDESSSKMESSESLSDCLKPKDTSPQGTSHSQDFPSLSTQENDSVLSNQPGTSPTYASSKKLEWDSGADIGYLNLDLTKENLSTIEKIVLKGLSSDGLSEKNVVYEKNSEQNPGTRSKFILERKPSDLAAEEVMDGTSKLERVKDSDTSSGNKKQRKCFTERAKEGVTLKEDTKDEYGVGFKETKLTSNQNSLKESSAQSSVSEIQPKEKPLELKDKSLNVNTLFGNVERPNSLKERESKEFRKSLESPAKLKFKKCLKTGFPKNKKPSPQKLFKAPKKTPISSVSTKLSGGALNMGIPKIVYKKVEAIPALNNVELSREVEEIIIDHSFKIKQNLAPGREVTKDFEISAKDKADDIKGIKPKNKPISASSSSNNTILPKSENRENIDEKTKNNSERINVIDQLIQTSDYDCESVGIQAFASQVSSASDFKNSRIVSKPTTKEDRASVNTTSKNIQAFGLTSSLPKQYELSKEVELIDNQNTKSTQFFGGPLNSLPNYHSNLVTKPGESCGRAPNILKSKKNSEAEKIRLKEENKKNILANDSPKFTEGKKDAPKLTEGKKDSPKHCTKENKENFINRKSTNSKKSQSDASRKKFKGNVSEESDRKKISLMESSDSPHMSDEVSSMVLTSEILKVHGDSIDRNIIQEKYFQSQLVELEKKKLISRSTSVEIQLLEDNETGKEYKTTGCQYSSQSKGTASEGNYQGSDDDEFKENRNGKTWKRTEQDEYGSSQNLAEDLSGISKSINQRQELGAGDSLPSSTQTAHSWIPGIQISLENTNGVGKARSFEYLPGHIYESSGNLREKLPSDTEKNLITSSSDSDTPKGSVSDGGARDSEGRNTLVIENSTVCSHDSDRLKILDENLEQLNFAVLKLWEKDAQIQSVTQSLLASLWKKSGSGDFSALGCTSKTEVVETTGVLDNGKTRSNTLSENSSPKSKKEFSIACQTEEKSPSNPEKFYEEKKALEKRISEEKKSQIKWIENEIHHLNILRELLEKQNSPTQKKKKLSSLTIASDGNFKGDINISKSPSKEICPRTATPVYGCTISLMENPAEKKNQSASEENDCQTREKQPSPAQYGMAVSLSGCPKNWKPLVMLPIDVQVSLKNSNLLKECIDKDMEEESHSQCHQHSSKSSKSNSVTLQRKPAMFDINTQYPSARRTPVNVPSTSLQTDCHTHERSSCCNQENCFYINLSENDSPTISRSSRSTTSEKRGSSKLRFSTDKSYTESGSKTNNTVDPGLAETEPYPLSQAEKKKLRNSAESDLSGNNAKYKSLQSAICKCQNCPKKLSATGSKPAMICKCPCQSNIYLNCDKPSDSTGVCHCSKIQVQKALHCTCHIIKIHGSKCCSPERSPCSCKRRSIAKKTENQFCQTDCGFFEVKNLCESKNTIERKMQISEKLPCLTKVAYEKVHPKADKLVLEKKSAVERNSGADMQGRNKSPLPNCSCKRKSGKEKPAIDDHPRHYFLRIEEAEVDDSGEEMKQKKSLEVITVTVPVKKAGKAKIYDTKSQTCGSNQKPAKSFSDIPDKECKCAGCMKKYQVPKQNYDSCVDSDYRRSVAEKPESPTRNSGLLRRLESYSSEDLSVYPCEDPTQFSSSREYIQYKKGFTHTESSYSQKSVHDSHESQFCENCNCANQTPVPQREIQIEYDSHNKRESSSAAEYYGGGNPRFHDNKYKEKTSQDCIPQYVTEPCADAWSSESRHSQLHKQNAENDQYHSDYYNYNKREYMTKSEILKEEEQKRKVHQPSLQDCLSSNRPAFYDSAERRRQIISERAKERVKKHNSRMECLLKMMQQCNENVQSDAGSKRIFTTVQMREQTMKRYKKLPEVTGKIADQKKKQEYQTNRLMADIFAKKLQIEALKGHTNLSNSVSLLYTL